MIFYTNRSKVRGSAGSRKAGYRKAGSREAGSRGANLSASQWILVDLSASQFMLGHLGSTQINLGLFSSFRAICRTDGWIVIIGHRSSKSTFGAN